MGRHEPPTNRSLYLSVAASTIRFAIILALVVGGVVVINQAFEGPAGAPRGTIGGDGSPSETTSPTTSPTEEESPREQASPTVAGTIVVVVNAAGVDGLAGDTTTALVDEFAYEALEPETAPSLSATTTIYYVKNRDEIEAEFLANSRFFRDVSDTIRVAKFSGDQDVGDAQLVITIGQDYAQSLG
jgi:hypothetical protein